MHRVAVAALEVVPVVEVLALRHQAIGAGLRQPADLLHVARRQAHAVLHIFEAGLVVLALAALGVEQLAGDVGEVQLVGVGVDDLVEAALAAAVAQALPLGLGHLAHLLGLPERLLAIRHR